MQLTPPTPLVDLSYRPDLHILVVRWLGVTADEETRRIYRYLEEADVNQCRFWLLDARRRPSSGPAVTRWMLDEFAPLVSAHFRGLLYFSYLISPAHLSAAEDFQRQVAAISNPSLPYRLHYASQESEATNWLLEAQASEKAPGRPLPTGHLSSGQ
ncbi:hypothetical protein [Hymenobacter sedentarius]|uniref:hypothetical protein n=1 Tax=Hymenobacter sedentarius TaxID=1411621 RepID=UPI000A55DDBD|nr:hypothetical protein [Hymenobacter sedentarius]